MTNRENFISLIRRKGYEHVPVEFVLCPSLQEQIKERFGTDAVSYTHLDVYKRQPHRKIR